MHSLNASKLMRSSLSSLMPSAKPHHTNEKDLIGHCPLKKD
jgi:hypothetical protein